MVYRLSANPRYAKAFYWGKLITVTGSAQVIVQAIGLISGVLVIRLLPTFQYALYTLANTMLGTMVLLADGGIATSVMAQGGKVWEDKAKLGSVLATGFDLRRKFAFASLLIAVPALLYLLRHNGTSWLISIVLVLSLIPSFLTSLSAAIFEIPVKLQQDVAPAQKNQVIVNTIRLVILAITLYIFPFAFIAVFASGLPQIWGNRRLRDLSRNYADYGQNSDPAIRKEIISFVSRIFPYTVYYCLSGQITIWLISIFGSTETIAQAGALGRLSMMLGVLSILFGTLVSPRFARLPANKGLLLKRFLQIQACLVVLTFCIITFVWLFPSVVLWILGKHYSNLTGELFLAIAGSCLNLIAGSVYALYATRGWAINPVISISISVASIVCGAVMINISSLQGILMFNIFVALIQVLMSTVYCFFKIIKVEKV